MKGIHLSTAHLREDCGYLRKAGQPDSRVVEVEADNPLILGLTICKKCQVLVGGEVAELETLMAL